MKTKIRSIGQIVEEQVQKWHVMQSEKADEKEAIPIITISRELGSGGSMVAEKLAEKLEFDIFNKKFIQDMAASTKISEIFFETIDEKGVSVWNEWISSLVDRRHLWPDQYLKHLMKVVGTIAKHGRAIILGRGANFVLPPGKRFRVRIVAPEKERVKKVSADYGVPLNEAERLIIKTESDRRAFIRKYFNADIADPLNYDLIINTGTISIDAATDAIKGALYHKFL
ncbi:MAG: cytidylate kinase-like family protein [Desulfosarcina sp.]|nr:cytidylate kinase-like family protein [Desulfobacterales bacterium]